MNQTLFPKMDLDTKRRLALVKIYRLLLRLAEEAKKESASSQDQEEVKSQTPNNES
jgi:hypothetical protein